jgi:ribosomal protein S18 acetylase RimI-like enzyme
MTAAAGERWPGRHGSVARMDKLRLRPMTAAEYDAFLAREVPRYAQSHVTAGDWSADEAERLAAEQMSRLLPDGPGTPGMLMLIGEAGPGDPVGLVWIALDRPGGPPGAAWIFYIEVIPARRGEGWGRALLRAGEQESARHGATAIGLNVFGGNAVARSLYESAGYQVASLTMRKELPRADR